MEHRASTTIAAPAHEIWDVLVDTDRWPEWDPHVARVDGQAILGGTIRMHANLSSTTIPVQVAELGPLVGILRRFMPDLQPSFEAHVEGLRARIEDRAVSVDAPAKGIDPTGPGPMPGAQNRTELEQEATS